ncbi:hypothetical protein FJV46_02765 [Arthrobacter agilis]|uniref:hypothetical protein n=1 Tax=Arthrobacter agilis TaxID=37921 RepID=UPI000B34D8CA|nr:hypothetical protein [Arthrobacter agilis]OUM40778.1 hypothetical protein B8W74_15000 [Arthrobacter agilis]PPB45383.1 hypothetical protein CI784_15030 [Arthrobacter agilis]TPV28094.1 hypothetical protein FJV46_02765 [Arthrobacter agilis]VDR31201.1 Uncharacterised protein [Arthrobacter agilis]
MSDLFSHPAEPDTDAADRPALTASVMVPAPVDHAWAGLTEHLHLWWPADQLSRWGEGSFFDLEDSALVETSEQDDENVWGERADGVPGQWLELTWRHVGVDLMTLVRLEMGPAEQAGPMPRGDGGRDGKEQVAAVIDRQEGGADATSLVLTHGGWLKSDPSDLYRFYEEFWPVALGRYRRFMGGS